ncbi:hypothetical protein JV173_04365 [Acholeplasma equirhinis]|uniref:MATE family efflux transporter n=1 Tax=Acholeplasma equirhinis TaxID=555393 RepID=UPI00197A8B83|nr:MATE family efflux transporter [Acholeplasma equirhinis]MBN3490744.1 hypothetical protein [Acholeplasma equirhinis]
MTSKLSLKDEKKRNLILEGNLWKILISLSIPLAIYEAFNYLYAFIDLWLVSGLDTNFVTSVIFIDEIRMAITAFGGSIASAGSVIVARDYAANKLKEASKNAGQVMISVLSVSLIVIGVMIVFAEPILRGFGANDYIIQSGLNYYIIQMATTGLVAFNAVFIGLEKAKGNTKIILFANLGVMIVKLILSYIWVMFLNGGLFELAISSMIAQGLLMMIGIYITMRKKNPISVSLNDFKPEFFLIKPILILAFPIFLGKFLFNMGKVFINGIALLYHNYVVAALGICSRIFGLFASVANVFHETEMTIISQNLGVNKPKRAIKTFYITILYALIVSTIGLIICYINLDWIIKLLGNFSDEQVEVIKTTYNFEQYSLVYSALISAMSGLFIGFKRTKVVFWINIIRVIILRLPVLFLMYTFIPERPYWHVGFVMFFSNTLTTIITIAMTIIFIRQENERIVLLKLQN